MPKNYPPFVMELEKNDPELFKVVSSLFDIAMGPGELDAKTKVLITLALDAYAGSEQGVAGLAASARSMGITEGQIAETLRIAYMVSGNVLLHHAAPAFNNNPRIV